MDVQLIILLCFVPVFMGLGAWWVWIVANSKGWQEGFKKGVGIWKPHAEWLDEQLRESWKRGRGLHEPPSNNGWNTRWKS